MDYSKFSANKMHITHQMVKQASDKIRGTVAIQLPSKDDILFKIYNFDNKLVSLLGFARCHKVDQYSRKIGKDQAEKNLSFQLLEITNIRILKQEPSRDYPEMGPLNGFEISTCTRFDIGTISTVLIVRFVLEQDNPKIRMIKAFWEQVPEAGGDKL